MYKDGFGFETLSSIIRHFRDIELVASKDCWKVRRTLVITQNNFVVRLVPGEDNDSIITRSDNRRSERPWVVSPSEMFKVSSTLDPHPLRNSNMDSRVPGKIYSFVYKFDFGHIAFINGKVVFKDVSDLNCFISELEKFDVLFPV